MLGLPPERKVSLTLPVPAELDRIRPAPARAPARLRARTSLPTRPAGRMSASGEAEAGDGRTHAAPQRFAIRSARGHVIRGLCVPGPRPGFVILPALGLAASNYAPLLRRLAGERAAWAIDLPGFGITPSPVPGPSFSQHLLLLQGALAQLEGPLALVGHSLSSALAIELARRHPDSVRGLVLTGFGEIHASGYWRRQLRLSAAHPERLLYASGADHHEQLRSLRTTLGRSRRLPAFESFLDFAGARALTDGLRGIEIPTLVCQGVNDRVIPVEAAEAAAARTRHASLDWLPNCGHMAPLEEPAAFRTRLEAFLQCIVTEDSSRES